jgi:glycine/sarcosine N-methyltransferase
MYDQFANDYDHFVNWENRLAVEIPFIEKVIQSIRVSKGEQQSVLDAACGTGMHAVALAKLGFEVTGADLSEPMIQKARMNGANLNEALRFEAAGFGSLANVFGHSQFDAVLCLGNSLPHLLTDESLESALVDFRAVMRPGGILLIQNRNFDSVMTKLDRWMEPQSYRDQDTEWIFQRFYDFESDGLIQFNIVTLKRSLNSAWISSVKSTKLKPQLKSDLHGHLNSSGFADIWTYGSMGGEPFNPLNSGNLVITARKR